MRLSVALLCLLLAVAYSQITVTNLNADGNLKDAADFIAEVQGDNKNVYIIYFKKDDEDYLTNLKTACDALPDDEEFGGYDLWQADYEDEWELVIGEIDARDLTNFKKALKIVGAYEPGFNMPYPLVMISREGNGKLASFGTQPKDDGVLPLAFKEKLLEASKAKLKDAPEGGDDDAAEDDAEDGGDEDEDER